MHDPAAAGEVALGAAAGDAQRSACAGSGACPPAMEDEAWVERAGTGQRLHGNERDQAKQWFVGL